jgi:3-oxoacyl-[acyl-carrier protein] reductase
MSILITENPVQLLTQSSGNMCRMGRADEVAAAVAFLACSDASFITGATLNVDGGYMARGA